MEPTQISFIIQMHGKPTVDAVPLLTKVAGFNFPDKIAKPVLLPFGQEGPDDLPRLFFEYKAGARFLMDGKMISFEGRKDQASHLEIDDLRNSAVRLLTEISSEFNYKPRKLASVVVSAYPMEKSAIWIRDRFFNPILNKEPLNRPNRLNLSAFKIFKFGKSEEAFVANSWVHVKSETIIEAVFGGEKEAVTFTSDLITESKAPIEGDKVAQYFNEAYAQHCDIRSLYMGG